MSIVNIAVHILTFVALALSLVGAIAWCRYTIITSDRWRQRGSRRFDPRRRLLVTYGLMATWSLIAYGLFTLGLMLPNRRFLAVGWIMFGLSFATLATLPFCMEGRHSWALRVLRRLGCGFAVFVSAASAFLTWP